MDIRDKTVLILGGYGLVGQAVARELLAYRPRRIVLLSLKQAEAEEAVERLAPYANGTELIPEWGDVFALEAYKDTPRHELLANPRTRREVIRAFLDDLSTVGVERFYLHTLIQRHKPDIIVDAINTATGIAYQNVYREAVLTLQALEEGRLEGEQVERLLTSLYIPQLIRHIQVLYEAMRRHGTRAYFKVGTTGTGGMGLNIPYTHSEERPSRVLLSKSAVAGAHTLLLFLMARTPDGPMTKEVKPAAAIAWKEIGYGPIKRRGHPIPRYDAEPRPLPETLRPHDPSAGAPTGEVLENVYIDTGENGLFSLEEFSALSSAEQMEFITPEEIAKVIVAELQGGNTGHDVIGALDSAAMGPTYRAGMMRHWALERMRALEDQHHVASVAFEMLGPPRLSKLLFEAHLLRKVAGSMQAVREADPVELTRKLNELILLDGDTRSQILSIGLAILLEDGRFIRGPELKVPAAVSGEEVFQVTPERLERWAWEGWVDLRLSNIKTWQQRFERIHQETQAIPEWDTSSRYLRTRQFWDAQQKIQPGKLAGWIFAVEEAGMRLKD
ncbi:short-chain dehydrogenase [Marinithermus hydrothermalis]|uniref:Short-chain dehydrogenase/reductase SDR n=1 Tax=Marinithermus hydrothermalis (strain DSM 14884 / JCM 11576 / T1) TaxID=869210 RepID=F2NQN5_MARHT|nr:short-chain dehydrogenase [Marinithermus hydrothermalis]AEB11973.1 short-chain dehydrogenase/reductase SDR [Marinithermus hydrothermalis DSM 14884]